MPHVTLLHTRFPLDEFIYDPSTGENVDDIDDFTEEQRTQLYRTAKGRPRERISGHWGTMAMVIGPRITYAGFMAPPLAPRDGEHTEQMDFVGRKLNLVIAGDDEIEST